MILAKVFYQCFCWIFAQSGESGRKKIALAFTSVDKKDIFMSVEDTNAKPNTGTKTMTTATVNFKAGDKVGMVHTFKGVLMNLVVNAVKADNMIEIAEPCGYSETPYTWVTPAERLFKR